MPSTLAVDYRRGLDSAWEKIATAVPKFLLFLLILVAGYLLAKAVYKLVDLVLERVGFDRAVERGGIKRALASSSYDASDLVAKIVQYAVLLLALQLAFGVFGPNPISVLIAAVIAFLPLAVVAIVIVVVASVLAKAAKDVIGAALGGLSYGRLLGRAAAVGILALGVIAALNQVHIATTVTTPILVTVLATIGGILVVGVGGGLIKPMQQRWEDALTRLLQEGRTNSTQPPATGGEAVATPAAAGGAPYGVVGTPALNAEVDAPTQALPAQPPRT